MAPRVESDTTLPLCVLFTLSVFVCFLLTGQATRMLVHATTLLLLPPFGTGEHQITMIEV